MDEEAKAVKEIAKTTGKAIDATTQFGGWLAKVFGKPADTLSNIVNDQLQFRRFKNGVTICEKAQKILENANIVDRKDVPLKLLIPLLNNSTLEEDEALQDMWAELIAKTVNPNEPNHTRVAYLEILSQLEPLDAQMLNYIFDAYSESVIDKPDEKRKTSIEFGFETLGIVEDLKIPIGDVHRALDNLNRLRLTKSFTSGTNAVVSGFDGPPPSHDYGYHAVCITEFGVEFVLICTNKKV